MTQIVQKILQVLNQYNISDQNLLFNFNENSMQLCLACKVPIEKSRGELCDIVQEKSDTFG